MGLGPASPLNILWAKFRFLRALPASKLNHFSKPNRLSNIKENTKKITDPISNVQWKAWTDFFKSEKEGRAARNATPCAARIRRTKLSVPGPSPYFGRIHNQYSKFCNGVLRTYTGYVKKHKENIRILLHFGWDLEQTCIQSRDRVRAMHRPVYGQYTSATVRQYISRTHHVYRLIWLPCTCVVSCRVKMQPLKTLYFSLSLLKPLRTQNKRKRKRKNKTFPKIKVACIWCQPFR